MVAIRRPLAELFHSKLELASPPRLAFAILVLAAAVVSAILFDSAYWYLAILLVIPLALKLSRNDEAIRLYTLIDSQGGLSLDANQFYGILNGWLLRGERKMPHIEFAEFLLKMNPDSDAKPSLQDKRAPIGFSYCRLKDIVRVEHESDKGDLTVVTQADSLSLKVGNSKRRDKLVEALISQGHGKRRVFLVGVLLQRLPH